MNETELVAHSGCAGEGMRRNMRRPQRRSSSGTGGGVRFPSSGGGGRPHHLHRLRKQLIERICSLHKHECQLKLHIMCLYISTLDAYLTAAPACFRSRRRFALLTLLRGGGGGGGSSCSGGASLEPQLQPDHEGHEEPDEGPTATTHTAYTDNNKDR